MLILLKNLADPLKRRHRTLGFFGFCVFGVQPSGCVDGQSGFFSRIEC